MFKICVVGFGARAEGMLRNFNTFDMDVEVAGVVDPNQESAKTRLKSAGFDVEKVEFFDDIDVMVETCQPDGIVVATRCDIHTELAIKVMKYPIPILLEKPVCINEEQLALLEKAAKEFNPNVLISFPLRTSYLCELAKEIIDSGKIGKISQVQCVNNVTYGRVYYKDWYRDANITGGLFLQKSTHDLDYVNYLLGEKPVQVVAMDAKVIFKGDKSEGKTCENCEEYKTCPESTYTIKHKQYGEESYGSGCSFAKDTGNHDSATIITRYESGIHSVYTQNFVARKDAAKRGARIIGYEGTLEFDWITGVIKVYSHVAPRIDTYEVKNNHLYHYGGDKTLCENFYGMMKGTETSKAPIENGILSAKMCLLAEASSRNDKFYNL